MLEKFIDYLKYEKRSSQHTINAYQGDLEQLNEFLNSAYGGVPIFNVSHDMLRSWMVHLLECKTSARSIARKISSVRSYFRWGRKFHGVHKDPTQKLLLPKIPKRLPVYVEEDAMGKLKKEHPFPNTFDGHRDYAIVELFYHTGIRISELIGLKSDNVDFKSATIRVLGKRNKERIIPVSASLLHTLENYLEAKASLEIEMLTDHFFINKNGKMLYPKLVYKVVNNYLSQVSSLKKKSPHVLRHSFATHMLNNGADLNAIKELLGHASLAATQVYTHNSIDKLKKIHRKAHPKG